MCTVQGPPMSLKKKAVIGLIVTMLIVFWIGKLAYAAGDSAHVAVTLPTQYIDNTPLAVSDITELHVQWFRPGVVAPVGERILTTAQLGTGTAPVEFDIAGLKCGDYDFVGFVVTSNSARDPGTHVPYTTGVKCGPKAVGLTVH